MPGGGKMDLISLPQEYDKKKIDSRYRLVIATAVRARQLSEGAQPTIPSKAKKAITTALEEIISGSVNILTGEAARKAKEKVRKLTYERMMDEAKQKETLPEDLTELEKDLQVYLHEKASTRRTIADIFEEGSK